MALLTMGEPTNPESKLPMPGPEAPGEAPTIPEVLPILPLKNTVVYPVPILLPLIVGQPRSIKLVDDVVLGNRIVGLVALKDPNVDEPCPDDVYPVGTVATIARFAKAPDSTIRLFVQGMERFKIVEFTQRDPYLMARVQVVPDVVDDLGHLDVDASVDRFHLILETDHFGIIGFIGFRKLHVLSFELNIVLF